MKSYSHLYEKIIDEDNLKLAIKNAIKGRTKKRRKKIKQYIENTDEAVKELKTLVSDRPLSIDMSMYGGFEQVGAIGSSLTSSDVQTVTEPGDIVLYAGSQIVIFYGSNSWAYTKLGQIDLPQKEMEDLLGHGDVRISIIG